MDLTELLHLVARFSQNAHTPGKKLSFYLSTSLPPLRSAWDGSSTLAWDSTFCNARSEMLWRWMVMVQQAK